MTSFLAKWLAGSLVCLSATAFAWNAPSFSFDPYSRTSIRHIEGGGIKYKQGYTTFDGFYAPNPEQFTLLPFLDLRGHIFDNGQLAANAGIGFRGEVGGRTYGLNAYYDCRNTQKENYNQVGLGLEALGDFWDFRINGYLPVGVQMSRGFRLGSPLFHALPV